MGTNPHDALFKEVFGEPAHAAIELRSVLPPRLSEAIAWSSLARITGSFVDDGLRSSESDLLFSAEMKGHKGPRPLRLFLLFEHQSTVDGRMPYRLLRYMIRIWEREEKARVESGGPLGPLPPIVPVVLHHSRSGWSAPTTMDGVLDLGPLVGTGIEDLVPRFRFVLDDLSQQSDEEIASRIGDLYLRLVLGVLREARKTTDPKLLFSRVGQLIREVRSTAGLRPLWLVVLRYTLLITVQGNDPQPFLDALASTVGKDAMEEAMNILEHLEAKGRVEGRVEGMRQTLRRQMQLKFGLLSDGVQEALETMDAAALEAATDRVLTAASVAEVIEG